MLKCPWSHPHFCDSTSQFRNNPRTNNRSRGNSAPCVGKPENCNEFYETVSLKTTLGPTSRKCSSSGTGNTCGDY